MPGPSSSQETELEYVLWQLPDSPPVAIRRRVQDGIHQDVNDAFAAAPHLGPETGGILLGRRDGDQIVVEDFEPVPSEHQFGPSYRLSDADRELLMETLDWFRAAGQPGLTVLGFYRSHTLEDFALCQEDEDLMRSHFAAAENLVVLVKPSLMGSSEEDFFMLRYSAPQATPPENSAPLAWPPPRLRLGADPERPARNGRAWYIAAAVLGLLGGVLGYLWLHPQTAARRPPMATTKVPVPASSQAVEAVVEGTPAPPAPDIAGIHELLNRWLGALKKGDAQTAALCYAPVVSTFFARHAVTREAVRQSLQQARVRYGRLDVYRISGLGITPVSDDRAVATFRKSWRTAGRVKSAGEEEERMTLVRNQGAWQISSEQSEAR
jgi:Domain of unknown function (DUF4440)